MSKSDVNILGGKLKWQDMPEGMTIVGGSTSREFNTGDWANRQPIFILDKCKQCLICVPVCPDSAIPVKDMKRGGFDYKHCKGCGICVNSCPFGAIVWEVRK